MILTETDVAAIRTAMMRGGEVTLVKRGPGITVTLRSVIAPKVWGVYMLAHIRTEYPGRTEQQYYTSAEEMARHNARLF